jgi:hypothetical protein
MAKDVVYVDAEDDITDIIGKIKDSKETVVVVVPPKRVGALQSAVNLKLLAKTAREEDKKVVLISNNPAIEPLAAMAKIPLAHSLQSTPAIPEMSALEVDDDDVDVINGEKIPTVGDLDDAAKASTKAKGDGDEVLEGLDLDEPEEAPAKKSKKDKPKSKVPDFNSFRKKLILIISAVVLVVGFLVWALVFAPRATIVIATRLSNQSIAESVRLTTNQSEADPENGVLLARREELTKKSEVEFDPTGTKQVGEKATGTLTLSILRDYISGVTFPAGLVFSTNGFMYTSTEPAVFPSMTHEGATVVVRVQANNIGPDYNQAAGLGWTAADARLEVVGSSTMAGGDSRDVKTVTADDIEKARATLAATNEADVRSDLAQKFGDGFIVIDSSFNTSVKDPVSTPAVDEEAPARAKLTAETVFSIYGVDRAQVREFLTAKLDGTINEDDQMVFSYGDDSARFSQFMNPEGGQITARLEATAEIGPKIDEQYVKDIAKGKRYGEVQGQLESMSGVENVHVEFSFFWVRTVPRDDSRITVEFEAYGNNGN